MQNVIEPDKHGLNDATGGRDADWFTGVLVSHCRANPSLTIADALEQIIKIRLPRLFAEKAPPVTYRSTATNNMLDKPPADETIRAATDRAAGKSIPPDTDTVAAKTDAEHEEACKKDYRRCTDNTDFMNNSDALIPAQVACQQAAEAKSKYGDPKWPWLAFSNYSEGNEVKTGRLLIGENNAQFQNGFGAWEHVRVVCEFDLKLKQVIAVDIIPKG